MSNTAGMDGNNKSTSTAYSVFAEVDELVSKPVLGTDGALAWQEFKKNTTSKGNSGITRSRGNAPQMPLKKADKLGTGLVSFSAERTNEENIRKAEGKAESECETLRQLLVPMWNWMENAARVRLGLLILCEAPRIEAER